MTDDMFLPLNKCGLTPKRAMTLKLIESSLLGGQLGVTISWDVTRDESCAMLSSERRWGDSGTGVSNLWTGELSIILFTKVLASAARA
jgi:hypothetical protein